ncbi:hypothetical protein [Mesorhizobium sp. M0207]|uniref:hypothetical protein n=1 Tax=Mesorhizobium sp. M0207 TaxID=2956915 RepID=UPI00333B2C9B
MSIKAVGLLTLVALTFAVGFLVIVVERGIDLGARMPKPAAALEPFEGRFAVQSIDDLRVAGLRIVLCGVAFTQPHSVRTLVFEVLRRDYQGLTLTCKPVGMGTPCDGNVSSKFGDALVVQCLTSDGTDVAAKLVEAGILCGQPAQAGSTYKPCAPGS